MAGEGLTGRLGAVERIVDVFAARPAFLPPGEAIDAFAVDLALLWDKATVANLAAAATHMLAEQRRQARDVGDEVRVLAVHPAMWPRLVDWLESQGHTVAPLPGGDGSWLHAPRPARAGEHA